MRTEWRDAVLLVEVDPLLPGQDEHGLVTLARRRREERWEDASHGWISVLVGVVGADVAARLREGSTFLPADEITPLMQGELASMPELLPRTQEEQWEEAFAKLEWFVAREGHARVPEEHVEDGCNLGLWVGSQRFLRAHDYMPESQASRLEQLPGWEW